MDIFEQLRSGADVMALLSLRWLMMSLMLTAKATSA